MVAEFVGSINWLGGETRAEGAVETSLGTLKTEHAARPALAGTLGIRPEDLELSPIPTGRDNEFPGELVSRTYLGDLFVHEIRVAGTLLQIKTMDKAPVSDKVYVTLPKGRLKFFPQSTRG